jgi:hypothetical protein
MRNLLALIGLLVIAVAAVGWYCGWYSLSVSKTTEGKPEITTTVNTDKATDDTSTFFKKIGQMVSDKAKQSDAPGGDANGTPVAPPTSPPKSTSSQGGWLLSPTKPMTP